MNYYERHIGDYLKDTAHLSLLEHGVYTRLMDVYYTREGPIPASEAARLIGARSKDEREALAAVLSEFFVLVDGSHQQSRCDREIGRYQDKQAKAKRSAEARWSAQRPQSDGNADASADAMRTHTEGNAPRARPQTPDTRHQEELLPDEANASSSSAGPTSPRARIPDCPYDAVVQAYHQALPMLPRVRLMDEKRRTAMRKRWAWVLSSTKGDGSRRAATTDEALAWLRDYFARAALNAWLTGQQPSRTHPEWKADLDFLLTDKGLKAVIERTEVPA